MVERVEIGVGEAPTVIPSVTVSTLPGHSPRCQVESTRPCELSLLASEITDFCDGVAVVLAVAVALVLALVLLQVLVVIRTGSLMMMCVCPST